MEAGRYQRRRVVGGGYSDEYRSANRVSCTQQYRCEGGAQTNALKLNCGSGVTITRVVSSGLDTPAAGAWKLRATWSRILDPEGRRGLPSGSGRLTPRDQTLGREQVGVSAGTFKAWKGSVETEVVGRLGPLRVMNSRQRSTSWYPEARGSGAARGARRRNRVVDAASIVEES